MLVLDVCTEICLHLFALIIQTYICDDPKIDNDTQEPVNCTNHTAYGKDYGAFSTACCLMK